MAATAATLALVPTSLVASASNTKFNTIRSLNTQSVRSFCKTSISATSSATKRSVKMAAVETAAPTSSITIQKESTLEKLATYAPFTIEGPNKQWTLWVCEPSEFPWVYSCVEHAYILTGTFYVTYEGQDPVKITAGDFVKFEPGNTTFKVVEPVRKFYHLEQ